MHISEELVRELQKKIDVSYEEAEYFLRKAKGDVNMAVFLIMKKRNSSWEKFKASLRELMKYRFILIRKGETIINLPLLLLALFILLYGIERHIFPLIVIFVIILLTECEVRIEKLEWSDAHYKKGTNPHHRAKRSTTDDKSYNEQATNRNNQQHAQGFKEAEKQKNQQSVVSKDNEKDERQNVTQKDTQRERMNQSQQSQPSQKPVNDINEVEDDYYEIVIEE